MDGLGLCIKKIPEDTPCAGTSSQPDPPLVKTLQVDLCRLCANVPDSPIEIYNAEGITPQLSEIINEYLPVKVSPEDELSLCCCSNCASTILSFHEFALSCVEAQKRLPVAISEEPKPIPIVIPPAEPDQQMATVDDEEGQLMDDDEFNEMNEDDESEEETKLLVPGTSDDTESSEGAHPVTINLEETTTDAYKKPIQLEKLLIKQRCKIRNDDGTVAFKCDICDKIVKKGSNFLDHYRTHDRDKSPFSCELCEKTFRHPSNLKRHVETIHMQIKKFGCELCDERYTSKVALYRHMLTHPGSRRNNSDKETRKEEATAKKLICDVCNKVFKTVPNLRRHVRTVHMQIKNFACKICERRFCTKVNLDEHMNTHDNSRPLKCDICNQHFNNGSGLRRHMKSHIAHGNKRMYKCGICDKQYLHMPDIKRHVMAVHLKISLTEHTKQLREKQCIQSKDDNYRFVNIFIKEAGTVNSEELL